jgi:hypothetical protein
MTLGFESEMKMYGTVQLWVYCSISFNLYGHMSHGQKSTKIFVSHPLTEAILGLAEQAELSRGVPVDQIP